MISEPCCRIILLGAPGSGKGTQALLISKRLGIPQISTGEILREEIRKRSAVGLKANEYIESGLLVPDKVVLEIVKNRIQLDDCRRGFIFDGFPRTIDQARALDKNRIGMNSVIILDTADKVVLERLSGRRVCSSCHAMFHNRFNPPKKKDVCDHCGAALVIRKDDDEQTIEKRLQIYHDLTKPVIAYYEKHKTVTCHWIDAGHDHCLTPEAIASRIQSVLQQECAI